MIVGDGQIARIFSSTPEMYSDGIIFASGVSASNCSDVNEFQREKNLLLSYSDQQGKKIVYFSSAALSDAEYPKSDYYRHKAAMENLITENFEKYFIFRVPQLFGKIKRHQTLINFLYYAVVDGNKFNLNLGAARYLITIRDLKTIVDCVIENIQPKIILNVGNPYRYSAKRILEIIENVTGKKAIYTTTETPDLYELDLSRQNEILSEYGLDLEFSEAYLEKKLLERIPANK
jgi:nucleoside-diphosphate-sugar epimerase